MDEEAEREASAYVQTAMSFAGLTPHAPRLTVVPPSTRDVVVSPAPQTRPPDAIAAPAPVRTAPVIPIGLPEGATLPPISEPRAIVAPLPVRTPDVFVAPAAPPVERPVLEEPRPSDVRARSSASATVAIMCGLGVLAFGVTLSRRRRRRSWSRA